MGKKIKKDKINNHEEPIFCENCGGRRLFLIDGKETNKRLCYTCFGALEGIVELTKEENRMANFGDSAGRLLRQFWEIEIPKNYEEVIKKRTVKKKISVLDNDWNEKVYDEIVESIVDKFYNLHSKRDEFSEEEKNDWFNKSILELDDYPDVPNIVKDVIVRRARELVERWVERFNENKEIKKSNIEKLMEIVKRVTTPEQFTKIEKTMEIWITDNEDPLAITEDDMVSATNGALHREEKHKEKPNGFCEICKEYYIIGNVKVGLTDVLTEAQNSVWLYGKINEFDGLKKEKLKDHQDIKIQMVTSTNQDHQNKLNDFQLKLAKEFENTKQDDVDEWYNKLSIENKRLQEEIQRKNKIKQEQFVMKSFEEAKSYILKQNLFSRTDYENFSKSSDFPDDMPPRPDIIYATRWKTLGDTDAERWKVFLGADKRLYDFRKDEASHKRFRVIKFLEELEPRLEHYMLYTPGMLTSWFRLMGLFHHRDPGIRAFVKQFINTDNTPEGRKNLQEALSKTIFNMKKGHFPHGVDETPVKETPLPETEKTLLDATRSSVKNYTKTALLEKSPAVSVRSIIEGTREIIPIIKDTKWWNIQISFVISMIWRQLFDPRRELAEIEAIFNEGKNGNAFHDEVLSRFMDEYNAVKSMKFWKNDYNFRINGELKEPFLNQLYTAYKMRKLNGFCNFSDPGIGKTNAALISTSHQDIKYVLIISPFNITKQWVKAVNDVYPNSFVSEGKEPFKDWFKGSYNRYYHVLNYEKFARDSSGELVKALANIQIDFVIIDESHHVKIRNNPTDEKSKELNISKTRRNVEKLLDLLRERNRKLKCLMLSATPVINNIQEGKSLLEMVTGTKYPDLKTINNLGNATELHTEFIPFSVRYIKTYDEITQEGKDKPVFVDAKVPETLSPLEVRNLTWMECDQIATVARIPEIVKRLKPKTIIYTDFVGGSPTIGPPILELLKNAVEKAGFTVGFFTGQEIKPGIGGKGGLEDLANCKMIDGKKIPYNPFVNGNLDVLIASSSIAEGINELQYVCDNMIFNGLVWTYADLKQIIGRLVREGQKSKTVTISLILARINGYDYDQRIKLNRVELKKILGNCVTDGTLPDMSKLPKKEKELKKMIMQILKTHESIIKVPIREAMEAI